MTTPGMTRKVHLFLDTGRTYTFENAEVVTNNETVLVVDYLAMSDGGSKRLTVLKSAIVAWSVSR